MKLIYLLMFNTCFFIRTSADYLKPKNTSEFVDYDIWAAINETTWWKNDNWAGQSYIFFENNKGEKKCIHQVHGSGVRVVYRNYADFRIVSYKKIEIGNEVFILEGNRLTSDHSVLTKFANLPLVCNRMNNVDIEIVKSEKFDVYDIDKKY